MNGASEILRTVRHGNWTLVFTRGSADNGDYLYHSVQILQDDVSRSRITVSRPASASASVERQLERRAREWITDYEARNRSGDAPEPGH